MIRRSEAHQLDGGSAWRAFLPWNWTWLGWARKEMLNTAHRRNSARSLLPEAVLPRHGYIACHLTACTRIGTSCDRQCRATGIVQSAIAGRLAVMLLQKRADRSATSLI